MKRKIESVLLESAYIILLLSMFILPFSGTTSNSLTENTLNDLGAQSAANGWIMNLAIVFIAVSALVKGWGYYKGYMTQRIFLVMFTGSLILSAFLHQEPSTSGTYCNMVEAVFHEYFFGTALLSFVLLSISTGFIPGYQQGRPFALAAGMSVIILSVIMSKAPQLAGIWQRLIFIISFGWLIHNFKNNQ
jgi:hypothetical membrane protein